MATRTLTLSSDGKTLTYVSDARVTAAVPEKNHSFSITVTELGVDTVYTGTRVDSAAVPEKVASLTLTDSDGVNWGTGKDTRQGDVITTVWTRS